MIDGGSSKNLINSQICQDLNIITQSQEPVNILLANGDTITSQVVCPELKWIWNGVEFIVVAQVVDMKDSQMILGVEWLSQLGDFSCNYHDHTMQFQWKGPQLKLSSNQLQEVSLCSQLSVVTPLWMEKISYSYANDTNLQQLITEVTISKDGPQEYYMQQGLLRYRGKWVIGATGELRK